MNTTLNQSTTVRTYSVQGTPGDFVVYIYENGAYVDMLRRLDRTIRTFSTRNGARKAITRALRGVLS